VAGLYFSLQRTLKVPINPLWYSQTILVERFESTITARLESVGAWAVIHAALPCAVAGVYSKVDASMMGGIPIDEYWLTVRESDAGADWPLEGDRVTMNGTLYYVTSVSDQTLNASFFTIPAHKIVKVSKSPVTPL
jgi:hypothetical protein